MQPNFWGELILCLRKEQGISQRALAQKAEACRNSLRLLETGRERFVDVEMLERVLGVLGHELEVFDLRRPWRD